MSDDKIVLFPTDRIRNKSKIGSVNPEQHARMVEKQTTEFVEATTDDIAYTLIDKFINAGIKTKEVNFTKDLALAIDTIRGLIYRDFKKHHPAQDLSDMMIQVKKGPNGQRSALCRYDLVLPGAKPQAPLSDDIKDEVRDLTDIENGEVTFTPDLDFEPDPENDN